MSKKQLALVGGVVTVSVSVVGILLDTWALAAPLDMLFGVDDFSGSIIGRSLMAAAFGAVLLVTGYIAGRRTGYISLR
ncbi:MAG: hypothetical protein VW450_01820 [Chloroflexota bacterium]